MNSTFKKTVLAVAVAVSMGVSASASAQIVDYSYSGMFTMLSAAGAMMGNTSLPHAYNEWDGYRTNIYGTIHFDTATGAGSGTVVPFDFFGGTSPFEAVGIQFQAIGNGMGGAGSLVLGNMLFNWNGTNGIPVSIVWDAQGMFASMGAGYTMGQVIDGSNGVTAASDGLKKGAYSMGTLAIATTGWQTSTCAGAGMGSAVSGCLPIRVGSISGGDPMIAGPFSGARVNFDVAMMCMDWGGFFGPSPCSPPPTVVPVPAAAWLLGSGLLGLIGVARRKAA